MGVSTAARGEKKSERPTRSCLSCLLFKLFKQSSPRLSCVFRTAVGSWHVVMVSILSVGGYFVRANGGCQTPCLVISACTVAETALASTPPPGHVAATSPRGGPCRPGGPAQLPQLANAYFCMHGAAIRTTSAARARSIHQ